MAKAKKSAKPKKAKRAVAKKAAAKKAAPKKAAAKKAAPKKAAAKKAAPKKPAAKAAKPAKPPKAPKPPKATSDAAPAATDAVIEVETVPASPLRDEILALAKQLYGPRGDAELLAFDPNDVDAMDPSIFYEILQEKYGVTTDPTNNYFGGFGGPIADLIKFVESRWDGKTRNEVALPPQDWLEEATYPAEETMKN
jgi:hypothetical protein